MVRKRRRLAMRMTGLVQSNALTAPLGDEPRFEAGDVAGCIRLDFEDPHVVNDHAAWGEVHKVPRAIAD